MGESLQEQMLKMGLVDAHKAREIDREKKGKARRPRRGKGAAADPDPPGAAARKAQAERDLRLNRLRHEEAERKAVAAQIRQLILSHRLEADGELGYNFVHGDKVKRVYVGPAVHAGLSRGRLSIVTLDGRYELVPSEVAGKIHRRDPERVVVRHRSEPARGETDDPYAGHPVPDDLIW